MIAPRTARRWIAAITFALSVAACSFLADYENISPPVASDAAPADGGTNDGAPSDASLRDLVGQPLDDAAVDLLRSCTAEGLFAWFSFESVNGDTVPSCGAANLFGVLQPAAGALVAGHGGKVFSSSGSTTMALRFTPPPNPYDVLIAREMTIMAWIQPSQTSWTDGLASILDKSGEKDVSELGWGLRIMNEGRLALTLTSPNNDESTTYASPNGSLPNGAAWIAARFDRGAVALFVNGVLIHTATHPHNQVFSAANKEALLGKRPIDDPRNDFEYAGLIDDVRIFYRALTDNEIASLAK